jgi:signal transduction histidine kinase
MSWPSHPSKDSARFERLVNALDHAIIWEFDDTEQRYTFVSDHSMLVLGYDSDGWAADPHRLERCIDPDDLPAFLELLTKLRGGEANDLRLEHRCVTGSGSSIWLHTGVHRADEDGHVIFRGVTIDINSVKTAEHREREARERAEEAVRDLEQVMAVVSHDLRNPLNNLLMGVRVLADEGPDLAQKVAIISRAARQMNRLVNDLVDMSSIRARRLRVESTEASSEALLDDALEDAADGAAAKNVTMVREPTPSLTVRCDPRRIAQVLGNLMGNAVKFSDPGGTVHVGARADALEVSFFVRNGGHGIAPENLQRVFERHWQAPETAALGQGLGLFIAKGIVDAHGGRIWAESEPGGETTFSFALPAIVASST